MPLEWLVSTCTLLVNLTLILYVVFYNLHYLKDIPNIGLLYTPSSSLSIIGFSDEDLAGSHSNGGPLLLIVPLLGVIYLPSVVKSKMSLQDLVLKLSIELWLILRASKMLWVWFCL